MGGRVEAGGKLTAPRAEEGSSRTAWGNLASFAKEGFGLAMAGAVQRTGPPSLI